MLKLVLKDGEKLRIGEDILIKVERGDSKNRTNLMIEAPREVLIKKEENAVEQLERTPKK